MIEDYLQNTRTRYHPYKSLPEYRIASLLDQYGLPFIYEKPTAVADRAQVRIWYPDFTLSYGPVIEYFGVNGDSAYQQRTKHKLAVYEQNQITVLPVYPKDLAGAWESSLVKRIDNILEQQLHHYRAQVSNCYVVRTHPSTSRYRTH